MAKSWQPLPHAGRGWVYGTTNGVSTSLCIWYWLAKFGFSDLDLGKAFGSWTRIGMVQPPDICFCMVSVI
jgi:hypothetical protein